MGNTSVKRRVTQKDVANHAGVSTSIVSYVINNGPRSVSPETRARVLRSIDELDYRPNKHARLLTRSQSSSELAVRQFGVIMGADPSMFSRPFYGTILSGVYAEAQRLQMRVRFLQFLDDLADPVLFNELVHPEEISGLLIFAFDSDCRVRSAKLTARETILRKAVDRVSNAISLAGQWGGLPAVTFDRVKAAYEAVSHLIGLGHTRIGYLGAHDDRLIGYRNALLEHGLTVQDAWINQPVIFNRPEEGHEQAHRIMCRENRPTALFACSDEVAIGAIGALSAIGLGVPDDVAIVSVDDIPLAEYVRPQLTSINVPKAQMGAYAVRMLHDQNSLHSDPAVSVMLPTKLIVRESCGARQAIGTEA